MCMCSLVRVNGRAGQAARPEGSARAAWDAPRVVPPLLPQALRWIRGALASPYPEARSGTRTFISGAKGTGRRAAKPGPMSTHAEAHDHGHGGHGGDHVPHVLPLKVYFATWGTLLVLTVITVGASYLDLGRSVNLGIALLIATIKALVVAAVFMHLRYDHKFHSVILFSAFLFLGIFISFTMFDTETRGRAEAVEGARPKDIKAPFAKATASPGAQAPQIPQDPEGSPPASAVTAPGAVTIAPPATAAPTSNPNDPPSNRGAAPGGDPGANPGH